MAKFVRIVGGDVSITRMFIARGWIPTNNIDKADLVQFTGGEDVTPAYYEEEKHPFTGNNPIRDAHEANIFMQMSDENKPMAGICRGGQFLNVMCGGSMWQHVNNHAIGGTHEVACLNQDDGGLFQVTSTHHQMIDPAPEGVVLLGADICTSKERGDGTKLIRGKDASFPAVDVESVFYEDQKVLCFQPHPEYLPTYHECQELYFSFLNKYLGV